MRHGRLPLPHVLEKLKRPHRLDSRDAIRHQSRISLELPHRPLAERPEDAVHAAAREPECVERLLQHVYVLPVKMGSLEVEHPVAKDEGGVYQRSPRLPIDHAPWLELVIRPERPYRIGGAPEEHAVYACGAKVVAQKAQPALYVLYGRAAIADTNRLHELSSS